MRPKERLKPNTLVELSFCTVFSFFRTLFKITKCNLYIYIYIPNYRILNFKFFKQHMFFSQYLKNDVFYKWFAKISFGMYLELLRLLFQTNASSQWQTNIDVRLALYREITLNNLYIEEPKKIAQKVKAKNKTNCDNTCCPL